MRSLTFLLIPLLFLSSCSINWSDGKDKNIDPLIQIQKIETGAITTKNPKPQTATGGRIKDFGSGFTLYQSDDETILSYSGKKIKTWLHTLSENRPYLWEEDCPYLQDIYNKVDDKETDKNWRRTIWDNKIPKNIQIQCTKEYLKSSIRTEQLNTRFYEIIQANYDTATSWIYDIVSGNLQEMPTMGTLKLTESGSGIKVFIDMTYGDDNMELFYNSDFSKFISKKEITK